MTESVVEVRELRAGYDETPIIDGLDLSIARGQIVAILGGSGSGKSTLLRALVGLLPPLSGSVHLFGQDLHAMRSRDRARLLRRVGMLFQFDALFGSMSVIDNVMYPLRQLTQLPEPVIFELARHRLGLMELAGLEHRFPSDMSGGQRKRAALARATILDPELVFCDEPTSGLDPIMSGTLARHLLTLRDTLGMTVVAVTHDVELVREVADRAILLGRGGIWADGSVQELFASVEPHIHAFFHRGIAAPTDAARPPAPPRS